MKKDRKLWTQKVREEVKVETQYRSTRSLVMCPICEILAAKGLIFR